MKPFPNVLVPIVATVVVTASVPALASPTKDIQKATQTFHEFVRNSNRKIPPSVIQNSQAIAIIPNIVRAGFIFGGRRGDGILMVRNADGTWSDPAFVNITGGSIGLQAGAEISDVILVFRNQRGISKLLNKKVELGGDVSVAAGPVGDNAVSATDVGKDVYSYTRNKGLFGGVALSGVNLSYDRKQSEEFYGRNISIGEILSRSRTPVPPVVGDLKATINQYVLSRNMR